MSPSTLLVGKKKGLRKSSWYRGIFKEAFRTAWNHKLLWFFGLFAALLSSGSELWSLGEVFSRVTQFGAVSIEWGDLIVVGMDRWSQLFQTPLKSLILDPVVVVGSLLVVAMVVLLGVAVMSQGALFSMLLKPSTEVSLKSGWRSGLGLFWKVAVVNACERIGFAFAFLIIGLPLLAAVQTTGITTVQVILGIIAFLVLIPLILLCALLSKFVLMHSISRSLPLAHALPESLRLLKANWLVVLEFIMIIFFINIAMVLAVRVIAAVLILPFLVGIALSYAFSFSIGVVVFYIGWILATLVLVVCSTAYLSTVEYAAWTQLYQQLSSERFLAKLERVVDRVAGWVKPSRSNP